MMWTCLLSLLCFVSFASARVEVHFYDSGVCGATVPSSENYFFDEGTCYLNRNFDSAVGCSARTTCLAQELEFDAYENCVAMESGANLTSSGSFEVVATATRKARRNFLSTDCSGSYTEVEIADECDLSDCGHVRSQVFPQNLNVVYVDGGDDDEDDDESDVTTGEVIGATVGSVAIAVLMCCTFVCTLFCCMVCILAIIMALASVLAGVLAKTAKPKKEKTDEEGGRLPKSSPFDRVKEAGLNVSSTALSKVPRGKKN